MRLISAANDESLAADKNILHPVRDKYIFRIPHASHRKHISGMFLFTKTSGGVHSFCVCHSGAHHFHGIPILLRFACFLNKEVTFVFNERRVRLPGRDTFCAGTSVFVKHRGTTNPDSQPETKSTSAQLF
jgi:hypothetical protein